MTVKELKLGIKEILKKHPDWEDYDLYNIEEQSYNFSLGFMSPETYKIEEDGNVSQWWNQQWFYDANNMDPPDDVKKQWTRKKFKKDVLNYLIKDRQNEISFLDYFEDSTQNREIKCGDIVSHYENFFYGNANIVIQLQCFSDTALKYEHTVWGRLYDFVHNAIKPFVDCQWTEETNNAIECKIQDKLLEWDGYQDNIHFDVTLAKNRPIEVEFLPPELGGTPVFFVLFKVR